jgi:hypothetical protein
MKAGSRRCPVAALALALLQPVSAHAAKNAVTVRAYVADGCIVADEPFFLPSSAPEGGEAAAKFLPLLGLVIGKMTELFINHEIQASANHYKSGAGRKDTRYAVIKEMNLYRADFDPAPLLTINAKLGCMTIVAGSFMPDSTDCTAEYQPKQLAKESLRLAQNQWKTSRTDDSVENQLRRANICMDGKARAVYETRFEFSKDGTAYRLRDAGYRIDSLLTTDKAGASRTTLYTLKISSPGATDQAEVLSSAWVNIGAVTAGARSSGSGSDAAPWLRVPALSLEARRSFDEKTRIQQEVAGEIEALQRALTRDQRQLAGLDARIVTAAPDLLEGLKQERTRIAVQGQSQSAELEARRAEYQDLPRSPLEFMPVTIEVAVTETESEKKAQVALADLIGSNSDLLASSIGNSAAGMISRSVAAGDLSLDPADAGPAAQAASAAGSYQRAHDRYYDALIAAKTPESQHNLLELKARYNEARRALGLEQIQ